MTIVLLVLAIVAGAGAASTACGVNMVFTFHASLDRLSWWRASADCASDDYIPTQPGTLLALHLQSGATETLGRDSYSARFL